jgi:hypothetical protein
VEVLAMTRGVGGESPANVQKFLHGAHYPAKKDELIRTAKKNKAPKEIVEVIEKLDRDDFGGPQDVMKAYGVERSHLHSESE